MRRTNFEIVGWHQPSFQGLIHLAYTFGRVPDFSRIMAVNNTFTFDHVALKFACNFAVSYTFERILKMVSQTGISIHQLASEIFDFLHSKDPAMDQWDNHQDWSNKHFNHVATPLCGTAEQRVARASFCPRGAAKMFKEELMSIHFKNTENALEALLLEETTR